LNAAQTRRLLTRFVLPFAPPSPVTLSKGGKRSLHYAADKGHLEVARLLLLHGAYALACTQGGKTPLDYAMRLPLGVAVEMKALLRSYAQPPA